MVFCPRCGAEYVAGFMECSDCLVPLVDSPPEPEPAALPQPESTPRHSLVPLVDPVCVFRSANPLDLAVAKSMLESASLPFLVLNESIANMTGLIAYGPAEVMVSRADAEDARAMIGDLKAGGGADEDEREREGHS